MSADPRRLSVVTTFGPAPRGGPPPPTAGGRQPTRAVVEQPHLREQALPAHRSRGPRPTDPATVLALLRPAPGEDVAVLLLLGSATLPTLAIPARPLLGPAPQPEQWR